MPYIKKIEINGFKTFGIKTRLLLNKGFTAITGPNGSGKTNIIDAVLFCLGELSARRLRAGNFRDLIFHGGSNPTFKKNKAKVVIQFDNSDNSIPVETATVTISREIDRNGQGVYRLNGRRVSRSHLLEILSMAGISVYGHNVVLQGTLTRIAEISPQERRKIIEDIIGIAQYDAEKAEAEEKLKLAEITIKTVQGKVGEIQKRVEDLERERNDLLRHNFIKNEVNRLEAVILSQKIRNTEDEINQLSLDIKKLEERIKKIREKREFLRSKRYKIERELRKRGFEEVEEGQSRILEIQIEIGDLQSKLSELSTKIDIKKASIDGLKKIKENTSRQIESIKEEIEESQIRIKQLTKERDQLLNEIAEKQPLYDSIFDEVTQLRSELKRNNERTREVEEQLDKLYQDAISERGAYASNQSRIKSHSQRLRDLKSKRDDLKLSLSRLQESLKRLQDVQEGQMERLRSLQITLERRIKQREVMKKEIEEAEKIAETAREALIEFEAQKEIVDKVESKESILKRIEELGELGVIPGIHGPLKKLIKIRRGYERAVEAAAAGWLNSLVVKDLNAAFTCIETLRRLKLGRIKIIPLQGLSLPEQFDAPKIDGIRGKVSAFVKCAEQYRPAVSFVLGDTLLASDEKAALSASRDGFRSVTLDGDLYEAGGAVESGFYRSPTDLSSFVPSESALKSLDRAVRTLQIRLKRREDDVEGIEREIEEARTEVTRLAETLARVESEIEQVRKSIRWTKRNIKRVERNIRSLQILLEREKAQAELYRKKQVEMSREEKKLREELVDLKGKTDLSKIQEKEIERDALGNEIMTLKQKVSIIETELAALQSSVKNALKTSLKNATIRMNKVTKQISAMEEEIGKSVKEKEEVINKIKGLENVKESLSASLMNAREEAKKFTSQIDSIDKQLQQLDREYEETDRLINELRLNFQTLNFQVNRYKEQLKALGYDEPLDFSPEQVQEAGRSLELMRLELERIGAVNQLAQSQYIEQVSRYKEISVRMNELEKEKIAIMRFIEEIEQKKRDAFMKAFNQINRRINKYFSKLTSGGEATLKLEKPENPFAGGVDMIIRFPDKPPIIVSGASSGERSVAAVAFLFALQGFTPTSFYLFDEIDAHLDTFHVERLGELLAEEAADSQFVVVTLKPEMVSKADRIYGVYQRDGISHVISTTFRRAI